MGIIPNYDEAYAILKQYNTEEFPFEARQNCSRCASLFCREFDPGRENFWEVVGLLHDLDFEVCRSSIASAAGNHARAGA